MKKFQVTINGESFPCVSTSGAMLRFKREGGGEITEIQSVDIRNLCAYP